MNSLFYSSLIPPKSSRENVQKWYNEGYDMVNKIITKRQQLIDEINDITDNEINTLKTELKSIRVRKQCQSIRKIL